MELYVHFPICVHGLYRNSCPFTVAVKCEGHHILTNCREWYIEPSTLRSGFRDRPNDWHGSEFIASNLTRGEIHARSYIDRYLFCEYGLVSIEAGPMKARNVS